MGPGIAAGLAERQLLWIDVVGRDATDLDTVAAATGIPEDLTRHLASETGRADLTLYEKSIHLVLESMDVPARAETATIVPRRLEIDLVAGRNWVVTVHSEPAAALDRIDELTHGETRFGELDAAGFMAAIVDEIVGRYLAISEGIEREIDRLDELALRPNPHEDVLARIVEIRRRIGTIRRTLAPHRVAFAALARPEMALHEELGRPWPV